MLDSKRTHCADKHVLGCVVFSQEVVRLLYIRVWKMGAAAGRCNLPPLPKIVRLRPAVKGANCPRPRPLSK